MIEKIDNTSFAKAEPKLAFDLMDQMHRHVERAKNGLAINTFISSEVPHDLEASNVLEYFELIVINKTLFYDMKWNFSTKGERDIVGILLGNKSDFQIKYNQEFNDIIEELLIAVKMANKEGNISDSLNAYNEVINKLNQYLKTYEFPRLIGSKFLTNCEVDPLVVFAAAHLYRGRVNYFHGNKFDAALDFETAAYYFSNTIYKIDPNNDYRAYLASAAVVSCRYFSTVVSNCGDLNEREFLMNASIGLIWEIVEMTREDITIPCLYELSMLLTIKGYFYNVLEKRTDAMREYYSAINYLDKSRGGMRENLYVSARGFIGELIENVEVLGSAEYEKILAKLSESSGTEKANGSNNEKLIEGTEEQCGNKNVKMETNEVTNASNGACYIATAVYGDYDADSVMILRQYRDNILSKKFLGRAFIKVYYLFSPPIAKRLLKANFVNAIVRKILDKIVKKIDSHLQL